jgi:hypothetical protein
MRSSAEPGLWRAVEMTEPSKERIAAALALAEAVDTTARIHTIQSVGPEIAEALNAYRATLPKLRSRSEVDRDIVYAARLAVGAIPGSGTLRDWHRLQRLCREPTSDSSASGADAEPNAFTDHDADERSSEPRVSLTGCWGP